MIDAKNKNKLRKDRITHVDKSTLRCGQVRTKVNKLRQAKARQSKSNRYVIKE